jgi:hypothetical protein
MALRALALAGLLASADARAPTMRGKATAPGRKHAISQASAGQAVTIDIASGSAAPTSVPPAIYKARVPVGGELPHQHGLKVDNRAASTQMNRPSLINYNPVANPGAVMIASDKMARFTVLTDRLIRMEYAKSPSTFEDYSTIAILQRNLPVPQFTAGESNGVLTITTQSIVLTYKVGSGGFNPSSLQVQPVAGSSSAFKGWTYGQADTGNLLGTIRGLDGQNNTPLNCT